jgi:hypothetical protein
LPSARPRRSGRGAAPAATLGSETAAELDAEEVAIASTVFFLASVDVDPSASVNSVENALSSPPQDAENTRTTSDLRWHTRLDLPASMLCP